MALTHSLTPYWTLAELGPSILATIQLKYPVPLPTFKKLILVLGWLDSNSNASRMHPYICGALMWTLPTFSGWSECAWLCIVKYEWLIWNKKELGGFSCCRFFPYSTLYRPYWYLPRMQIWNENWYVEPKIAPMRKNEEESSSSPPFAWLPAAKEHYAIAFLYKHNITCSSPGTKCTRSTSRKARAMCADRTTPYSVWTHSHTYYSSRRRYNCSFE